VHDPKAIINAYIDNELTEDQLRELAAWMCEAPENRRRFITDCYLHSQLQDIFAGEKIAREVAEPADADHGDDVTTVASSGFIPFASGICHDTLGFFSQEIPFALLIATFITSLGLVAGSMIYVTHHQQVASDALPPNLTAVPPKTEYVGQVTGMVHVIWADDSTAALDGAGVPLGRKYALASGLMEITYHTGAKVILQGPVTYEADSRDGGYLSVGKLTARLEKKQPAVSRQPSEGVVGGQPLVVSGQWPVASNEGTGGRGQGSEAANQKSEIRNHKSLAPAFAVRTPTAIVTDLGTEFGVEVLKNGDSQCHVFQGSVETAALNDGKPDAQPSRLVAGQTGLVTSDKTASSCTYKVFVTANRVDPRRFIRSMPTAAQVLHQVVCDWRIGARDEFKVAKDDLANAGRATLGKIELVAGEAGFGSDVLKLIDGDTYAGQREDVSEESFTPKDGAVVVVTLNTSLHPHGYDVKSIVSLTASYGEAGQNRSSQKYDVAYAAVDAPDKFIPLRSKEKNTVNCSAFGMKEVQVMLTSSGDYPMASGVGELRFTFHNTDTPDPESMYREIDVIGVPTEGKQREQ